MRQVFKIDSDGFYIEPVLLKSDDDEIPKDCIETPMTEAYFKAKWDGSKWVESMSQEEIDELMNQPKEPSELDMLREEMNINAMAFMEFVEMMTGGGVMNDGDDVRYLYCKRNEEI